MALSICVSIMQMLIFIPLLMAFFDIVRCLICGEKLIPLVNNGYAAANIPDTEKLPAMGWFKLQSYGLICLTHKLNLCMAL